MTSQAGDIELLKRQLKSLMESTDSISVDEISRVDRIRGGNSSEIWRFDARWREGDKNQAASLVLRRGSENEFASLGRPAEYRLLRALDATGIPAPRAYWADMEGKWLGRPSMIMESRPGQADRHLLTDRSRLALGPDQRVEIARTLIDILVDVHRIDAIALGAATGQPVPEHPAREQLEIYDAEILRIEPEPMPELRLASWWLHDNLPQPPCKPSLIHGDFRPANFLVDDGHVSALLDWEFAHIGDAAEDLGWYLTPYYRAEHLIPGAWSAEDVIARYEQQSGVAVDREAVAFWTVFAMYKIASMTMGALKWFMEGDNSRMTASARFIIDPLLESVAAADAAAIRGLR
jgi:aminoglycoside phosphotransferase (APT) family kinase protein